MPQNVVAAWHGTHQLWLYDPARRSPRELNASGASAPTWSASGNSLLYVAQDGISQTELSLRLRNDLAHLDALARLAQRQKACCRFFGFTIQIDTDSLALRISVPEDAAWLLGHFARSAGAHD